jgi:hypothetical protein
LIPEVVRRMIREITSGFIKLVGQEPDRFKVSDVPFDSFFGVLSVLTDRGDEISFEVEGNDFLFVSLATALVGSS